MKTVTQFPSALGNGFAPHGLFSHDFREVNQLAAPLDFTVVTHSPDRDPRLVFHLREFGRVGARRGAIDTPRRFSSQRLMRALPVIFLHKRIILALLLWKITLRRYSLLQGSMHSLMAAVLGRFPRPDPLRLDPKLDPPFRELAEPAQGQRRAGRSIIGANHLGQPRLPKDPLKPRLHFLMPGSLKRAAQKQIPGKIVANGQRITATAVAQQKVPLEVCTPTLIGRATLSKGFAIRSHPAPPLAGLNQTRTLQDFARRRIRRPLKFRPLTAQPVQHFFRAPLLALQLGLHNQCSQLLRGLIGMSVRRSYQFLESWHAMLLVTPDPLVCCRPANPIDAAKLAFPVITTQPIGYQLNSLVHRTGFLPRHRHPPPGRCNVNHVPGLFCKRSYRFVPHPSPLPTGEGASTKIRCCRTSVNRNRGRIALSPSQPGLNPRSSYDDRYQDVLCSITIAAITQLVGVECRASAPSQRTDRCTSPTPNQATDNGATEASPAYGQLIAVTMPNASIRISLIVVSFWSICGTARMVAIAAP